MSEADKCILQEASELVDGDRRDDYGSIEESSKKTAAMWSLILDHEVTPEEYCLCMIGTKIVREMHKHKHDNRVDMGGYAKLLDRIVTAREAKAAKEAGREPIKQTAENNQYLAELVKKLGEKGAAEYIAKECSRIEGGGLIDNATRRGN